VPIEVQLRTVGQQDWADEIERIDSLKSYGLKDGIGPPDVLEYTQLLAQVINDYESGMTPDAPVLRRLRTLRPNMP
jgi:hypothetical protein